jgi:8-oxo-dGTP pyrophosphatase MutT (NUDIX family)
MAEKLGRSISRRPVAAGDIKLFKACGALLLANNTKRVLFLLRDDDTYSNTWGLVGGKVENEETVMEALRREIFEEVGHDVDIIKTIPLELFRSDDQKFEYHTFICVIDTEFLPKLSGEHSGYAWTLVDNFPKPLHPGLWSSLNNYDIQQKLTTMKDVLEIA